MEVIVEHRCQKEDLALLPKNVLKAFYRKAEILGQNHEMGKPLVGELQGYYRLSLAGRYRIIYTVDAKRNRIWVVFVGIRKAGNIQDIYSRIRRIL